MPGIDGWLEKPSNIVENIFMQASSLGWEKKILDYFLPKFQDKESSCLIPSLNDVKLHDIKSSSLVKFRCMIQDMFDPEYYLQVFETVNTLTKETKLYSGKYCDLITCRPQEEVNFDSPKNVTKERQTFYCIPVPGEAGWVKELYRQRNQMPLEVNCSRPKRSLSDLQESTENDNSPEVRDVLKHEVKRNRTTESSGDATSSITSFNFNFPLPNEKGPACLVKVYDIDNDEIPKLNNIYEFFGILSIDPELANCSSNDELQSAFMNSSDQEMNAAEQNVHCPPPSLVPRLHVIMYKKLQHSNMYHLDVQSEGNKTSIPNILSDATLIRTQIHSILQQALYGDSLSADYLLCHLISSIYARHDIVLGKYSLNLIGCQKDGNFPRHFYSLLQQILSKSYILSMTLDNMNSLQLIPKKDYAANRLCTGLLQLSNHTHLILDETALHQGQLNATGVKNITALGQLISWQKLDYDFNFHKMEYLTDIPVLILSEGRSLLPSDCQVPLEKKCSHDTLIQHLIGCQNDLSPDILVKIRSYLSLLPLLDFKLSEELQQSVQEYFVESRRESIRNMTTDDLHSLLVLARLLTLSYGLTSLTKELWEKAKRMELERRLRIINLPQRTTIVN